jgi:hypothetical protein
VPLDDTGSTPVRQKSEDLQSFDHAVLAALAPLDTIITGPRRRAEALAGARQQIHAAAAALVAAERRRVVQMTTSGQLRKQVLELVAAYEELCDFVDDIERQPVIAGEVKRLRCRGEIRWVL